jgi:tetratricopeptide (TPR) repeat protein
MSLFSVLVRLLMLASLVLGMSGCFPLGDRPTDEERDPNFLTGKSRLANLDYDGAIAAFENALVSNPKSAAAHFELGLLYEEQKNDYAAAIYHFERHLELRPESNVAETVKQHVLACKLELARTVPFALVNRQVQDELRHLYATNAALHEQVDQLKAQLAEQATAFSNKLAQVTLAAAQAAPPPLRQEPERAPPRSERPVILRQPRLPARAPPALRTYVIRPGDTLAAISRRYNVKLSALQAANPGVEPRRLKAGQVITIPAGRD